MENTTNENVDKKDSKSIIITSSAADLRFTNPANFYNRIQESFNLVGIEINILLLFC